MITIIKLMKTSKYLWPVELLPVQCQTHCPYNQSANTIQNHPCRCWQFFSDTDAGKIKECNTNHRTWFKKKINENMVTD